MSYSNVGDAGAKVIKIFLLTKFCFMKIIEALKDKDEVYSIREYFGL